MLIIENESTSQKLSLDGDGETLWVESRRVRFNDSVSAEILVQMARAHPRPIEKTTIRAILLGKHRDPDGMAKAIVNLRKSLQKEGIPDLIKTLRGQGYAIASGWTVYSPYIDDEQIADFLSALRDLRRDAVDEVGRAKYMNSVSGLQYVAVESGRANQHFVRFQDAAWGILLLLSSTSKSDAQRLHLLKKQLFRFASYVTFWRVGTRYEEEEWKDEFRREIDILFEEIETTLRRLTEYS